ncbi:MULTISPECIES: hypothetical protein [Bacillus amyloliquefaciens group]|uniref:hypothetical protein n=1 Tax=Bacillus amyloliquefaciens group TaxID=1938374 RepID=UPI0022B7784F|nr:hypothetical protein [Bacillus siamensis]MDU0814639.1 hypothetical protein [Bacillus siamensis]
MTEIKKNRKNKLLIPKANKPVQTQTAKKFFNKEQAELLKKKHEECLTFSFIYFNRTHELFNCGRVSDGWFLELFDSLKSISDLTKTQFLYDPKYKAHYDPHQHDWDKVDSDKRYSFTEKYFNQYKDDCWQFRLSSSKGRVHGFIQGNVFYVVWLDPHHNFYPNERFGGAKYFDAPLTPYQELEIMIDALKQQNKDLESEKKFLNDYIELLEDTK